MCGPQVHQTFHQTVTSTRVIYLAEHPLCLKTCYDSPTKGVKCTFPFETNMTMIIPFNLEKCLESKQVGFISPICTLQRGSRTMEQHTSRNNTRLHKKTREHARETQEQRNNRTRQHIEGFELNVTSDTVF